QQLEGTVDERALGGPRGRRLGQTIDGGELEREPTVLERRHLRRRERGGELEDHHRRRYSGGVTALRTRRARATPAVRREQARAKARGTDRATASGASSGPKWPRPGTTSMRPRGRASACWATRGGV